MYTHNRVCVCMAYRIEKWAYICRAQVWITLYLYFVIHVYICASA